MSYVSSLIAGKMSPEEFVTKSAGEITKALKILPPTWADFLFNGLQALLAGTGLGATVAAIIVQAVRSAVFPPPPAAVAPPSPPSG